VKLSDIVMNSFRTRNIHCVPGNVMYVDLCCIEHGDVVFSSSALCFSGTDNDSISGCSIIFLISVRQMLGLYI
jgi:hypothetical protein